MLEIECYGPAYHIGFQHGLTAKKKVQGSIRFYADLFMKYTGRSWDEVLVLAREFHKNLIKTWPRFEEEMKGVADGAGCGVLDIVALNVRTEIGFGLFNTHLPSDGCTAVAWSTPDRSYLGQNWDWMEEQEENLVLLHIKTPNFPTIKMITEAGIIGKIGFNSAGVGVCLNAIRARGLDTTRIPTHLALRIALECSSVMEAVQKLSWCGMAGSAHILIADGSRSTGLEHTSSTLVMISQDLQGRNTHTNHMLRYHQNIDEFPRPDSFARLFRMQELTDAQTSSHTMTLDNFGHLFQDHHGFPEAICRVQEGRSHAASLFNIVMDLKAKRGILKIGRPCAPREVIEISFADVKQERAA